MLYYDTTFTMMFLRSHSFTLRYLDIVRLKMEPCNDLNDVAKYIIVTHECIQNISNHGVIHVAEYIVKYYNLIRDAGWETLIRRVTQRLRQIPNFELYTHDFIKLTNTRKHHCKQLYVESLLKQTILCNDVAEYISMLY